MSLAKAENTFLLYLSSYLFLYMQVILGYNEEKLTSCLLGLILWLTKDSLKEKLYRNSTSFEDMVVIWIPYISAPILLFGFPFFLSLHSFTSRLSFSQTFQW